MKGVRAGYDDEGASRVHDDDDDDDNWSQSDGYVRVRR